jgi:iron complex outermembrane receptor protein
VSLLTPKLNAKTLSCKSTIRILAPDALRPPTYAAPDIRGVVQRSANKAGGGNAMQVWRLLLFSAAACCCVATCAAASEPAATVGEVVVTAEKREQSIQKAPVSITVFTSADRDLRGIQSIQDITNFTPGLVYDSQLDRPTIRGIGRQTNTMTVDGAVATYSDNFYTTSAIEAALDSLFVDRTEIERGPQGTLFGRNAIGGLINVVSRRPTDHWYAEVRTTQGSYGVQQYEGAVSGPITDGLNFRLAGAKTNQYQGFFTNVVPNKPSEGSAVNIAYLAGYLDGKLGPHAEFWAKYATSGFENHGGPGARVGYQAGPEDTANYFDPNASSYFFNPAFGYSQAGHTQTGTETNNPALINVRDFAANEQQTFNLHNVNILDVQFTDHFPSFDMKYTGGLYTYGYSDAFGATGVSITSYQIPLDSKAPAGTTPLTVFPTLNDLQTDDETWWSNEVTFTSTTSGPLQWIAGAFFYHQDSYVASSQFAPDQPQVATPKLGPPNPIHALATDNFRSVTTSEAGYGQLDWRIAPTLKVTAGLRYTTDQKTGLEQERVVEFTNIMTLSPDAGQAGSRQAAWDVTQFAGACNVLGKCSGFAPPPGVTSTTTPASVVLGLQANSGANLNALGFEYRSLAAKSSAVTGTAGAEWTPDAATLVYFRYSRGYRAAALNGGTIVSEPLALPEILDAYEVGLKKTFGHSLTLDASIYYYDYHDFQLPISTLTKVLGAAAIQSNLINIPSSRLDGFELESIWTPTARVVITTTYSFNDSAVQSACTAASPAAVPTGSCFVDSLDPAAVQPGARPVGLLTGTTQVQSVKGAQLPQSPRNKLAINGAYTIPFERGALTFSGSFIWRDVAYASVFNRVYNAAPSWDQVDLLAIWKSRTDRYEVIAYVKNVFNTLGYQAAAGGSQLLAPGAAIDGTGPTYINRNYDLTDPRVFGVQLHYKFF